MRIKLFTKVLAVSLAAVGVVGLASGCQVPATVAKKAGVVALAKSEIGKPYAPLGPYERNGPDRFDCQGLVWYVFSRYGVNLPHGATAQYNAVQHISAAQAGPGDLVFFHLNNDPTGWYYHHVGIVTGPNLYVSALGTKYGVVQTTISGSKDRNGWVAYGRVF